MKELLFKDYRIKIGGGILAIIALHFAFQFFFIQNENLQIVNNLAKTEQFEKIDIPATKVEVVAETADVSTVEEENFVKEEVAETKKIVQIKTVYQPKRVESEPIKKQNIVSMPVQVKSVKSKAKSYQPTIKRKIPKETTAERLRRAERILTGA